MKKMYSAFGLGMKDIKTSTMNLVGSKKKISSGLFGVPLEDIIRRPEYKEYDVPIVVQDTIRYIEEKGKLLPRFAISRYPSLF
jgi:hypothetical protein